MPPSYRTRETMCAVQAPDVYAGENCDQHRPRWVGSGEGDKDGDTEIGGTLSLAASTFPPGTIVTVAEPECPHCHMVPSQRGDGWQCECDFDWRAFTEDHFW